MEDTTIARPRDRLPDVTNKHTTSAIGQAILAGKKIVEYWNIDDASSWI